MGFISSTYGKKIYNEPWTQKHETWVATNFSYGGFKRELSVRWGKRSLVGYPHAINVWTYVYVNMAKYYTKFEERERMQYAHNVVESRG